MNTLETLTARYKVGRELGRGGMGRVFECRSRTGCNRLALKVSLPTLPQASIDLCSREAKIIARIRHPNVPRVIGHGVERGVVWLAMEALEGGTLAQRLKGDGAFGVRQRLVVLRELAILLADLHHDGVVHNDLKPSNLMFTRSGGLRLIDFGIADVAGDPAPTVHGPSGTPYAIAPEKLFGDPSDHRSDIFQLGVLAYDLFCTAHPWERESFGLTAFAICTEPPMDFLSLLSDTAITSPVEMALLATVVRQSLSRDPNLRPATTIAWVNRIDALLATMLQVEQPVWVDAVDLDGRQSLAQACAA